MLHCVVKLQRHIIGVSSDMLTTLRAEHNRHLNSFHFYLSCPYAAPMEKSRLPGPPLLCPGEFMRVVHGSATRGGRMAGFLLQKLDEEKPTAEV